MNQVLIDIAATKASIITHGVIFGTLLDKYGCMCLGGHIAKACGYPLQFDFPNIDDAYKFLTEDPRAQEVTRAVCEAIELGAGTYPSSFRCRYIYVWNDTLEATLRHQHRLEGPWPEVRDRLNTLANPIVASLVQRAFDLESM